MVRLVDTTVPQQQGGYLFVLQEIDGCHFLAQGRDFFLENFTDCFFVANWDSQDDYGFSGERNSFYLSGLKEWPGSFEDPVVGTCQGGFCFIDGESNVSEQGDKLLVDCLDVLGPADQIVVVGKSERVDSL